MYTGTIQYNRFQKNKKIMLKKTKICWLKWECYPIGILGIAWNPIGVLRRYWPPQNGYWPPPIPLWRGYWVPNTCFEKHSLINRELCERSFVGFLKQHDTFYNHVCKVFQQYRIIYNSTEYSWFSAWNTLVDVLKISRSILVHDTGYINGKT